jgi:hypothetical protein
LKLTRKQRQQLLTWIDGVRTAVADLEKEVYSAAVNARAETVEADPRGEWATFKPTGVVYYLLEVMVGPPCNRVDPSTLPPGVWAPERRAEDVEELQLAEDLQEVAEHRQDPEYQRDVEAFARWMEEERRG